MLAPWDPQALLGEEPKSSWTEICSGKHWFGKCGVIQMDVLQEHSGPNEILPQKDLQLQDRLSS